MDRRALFFSSLWLSFFCSVAFDANGRQIIAARSATESYLEVVPLEKLRALYREKGVQQPEFLRYLLSFQKSPWLEAIIAAEPSVEESKAVLYHAVRGQRIVLDLIQLLQQQGFASSFFWLRDPSDPHLENWSPERELEALWPDFSLQEKRELLEPFLGSKVAPEEIESLWLFFWRDRPNPLAQEKWGHAKELFEEFAYFHWIDSSLSEREKEQLNCLYDFWIERGGQPLLEKLAQLRKSVDFTGLFRTRNLAVHFSLFSGCAGEDGAGRWEATPEECTLLYWTVGHLGPHRYETESKLRRSLLEQLLQLHRIPLEEVATLEAIHSLLPPEEDALLLQILLPKEQLNDWLYISHPGGRPARELAPHTPLEVEELYARSPAALPGFSQLQGRLLFFRNGALHPKSGVEVRLYPLPGASPERKLLYQKKLQEWADRILKKANG